MRSSQKKEFLLNAACLFVLAAALYLFFRFLLWWLLPFLLAAAAAAAMEPAVSFLRRSLRFKRGFSAALLTLFLLFLLGGLLSLLLSALFSEATGFLLQVPALLDALPALTSDLLARLEEYCSPCPAWLQELISSQLSGWAEEGGAALAQLSSRLLVSLGSLASAVPRFVLFFATTVLAVFFTSASYPGLRAAALSLLPEKHRAKARLLRSGVTRSIVRWLRAQAILFLLTFCQLLLGFSLLGDRFALLAAFLTALVDALPVFGTGTVLIPWALVELLLGSVPRGAALIVLYLCTLIVRNVAEPRLISAQTGLPSVASLAAMYLGFRAFGVAGMILFPFLLLLASQVRAAGRELPAQPGAEA